MAPRGGLYRRSAAVCHRSAMPTDQYHEPPDELSDETRTFARVIASLQEEAEAIGWYEQRMSIETNDEARRIMEHAQREEFLHFSMDLEFLARRKEKWRYRAPQTSSSRRATSSSAPSSEDESRTKQWRTFSACSTTTRSTAIRPSTRATTIPTIERYPGGQTTPTPERDRLHAGRAARQRLRRARAAQLPRGARPPLRRHVRQGRRRLRVRARAARRRRRHLAAVLARVPDRRAHREGAEPEARDHRRHRLRPRRPAGRDRARRSPSPR